MCERFWTLSRQNAKTETANDALKDYIDTLPNADLCTATPGSCVSCTNDIDAPPSPVVCLKTCLCSPVNTADMRAGDSYWVACDASDLANGRTRRW